MIGQNNKVLLASAAFAAFFTTLPETRLHAAVSKPDEQARVQPGSKLPFMVRRGDCELIFGGKAKIENYFEDNTTLLNKLDPDQNFYFKETVDLTVNVAYGKEKFGHKAVELFTDIRHKGIWGKGLTYADKDAGPIGPSNIKFNDKVEAIFGTHSHTSGRTLLWFYHAWLRFSMNAAVGSKSPNLHFFKLGWFPFDVGRGIAYGGIYGVNKEFLGLYSYPEDKSAPGINLHGTIIQDCLDYDLYFSRFEERGKNFNDTITYEKRNIVGRSATPWRGVGKNDDLLLARLQWHALKNNPYGDLDIEPYVFYNPASDQKIEVAPDCKAYWGSYGVMLEHSYKAFEWGAEAAFNYGKQYAFNFDRNKAIIVNINGQLVEQFTNIVDAAGNPVLVTPASRAAARQNVTQADGTQINIANGAKINTDFYNGKKRFRPAYTDKYAGWMTVVDAAYTKKEWDMKFAVAYGYASGDTPPNTVEKDKTYNGFIGLHEWYTGKRVTSIFLLDARLIKIPVGLDPNVYESQGVVAAEDTSFSDLQHVGFGVTWTPKCAIRNLTINPNVLAYWKTKQEHKVIVMPGSRGVPTTVRLSPDKASTFLGTEFNFVARCQVIKDLTLFGNGAVFLPGQYFKDVTGVPVGKDVFDQVVQDDRNDVYDASQFRIASDNAYHLNIGLEYKF